jgi:galactokinase
MAYFQGLSDLFQQRFEHCPEVACEAPGRVNLIGDHTDYNDGFVLPAAINFGTAIVASKRNDNQVLAYAEDYGSESDCFDLDAIEFNSTQLWSNYLRGTLKELQEHNLSFGGINLLVTGDVPQEAGLSSSASFEVAVLKTVCELYNLNLSGVKAAMIAQCAENDFVGCNCGIMDQLISAQGLDGHAMLLDCRELTYQDVPIPPGMEILVVNSNIARELVDSEYNLRRQQCEQVAQIACKPALRDMDLKDLEEMRQSLSEVQYKRARHVITENSRTLAAAEALSARNISVLSQLMRESHCSLRDDFQVTTVELDGLVEIIGQIIGDSGGVRMTGGGFGGCVVALVPSSTVESIIEAVNHHYPHRFGITPSIYQCQATMGAFRESS